MKFEVINDKNKVVMNTEFLSCIPEKTVLNLMSKSGYRFRLNNKIMSVKKLDEQLKLIQEGIDEKVKAQ